jgi:hypothetical protein
VHDKSCGLIDDNKRRIFIKDMQRHGSGDKVFGFFHLGGQVQKFQAIAVFYLIAGFGGDTVHLHIPGFNQPVQR